LTTWKEGGEESLKLVFNHIFSQGWEERRPQQNIIKIMSGDGETIENPVKFSTTDLMKRVRAESWYMSYLFGKEGQNWEKGMHFTTSQPDTYKMISAWNAAFPDGTSKTIYFDTNKDN
jgi:hypothetical protein